MEARKNQKMQEEKSISTKLLKRFASMILLCLICFSTGTYAQNADSNKVVDPDTTRITWGKKKIIIIDNDPYDEEEEEEKEEPKDPKEREQRWNHFAGLDLGINGLLNSSNSVDLNGDEQFMDLNYRRSISFAINLWEWYIPIADEKFGIASGLGFEFNKYSLDRDFDIISIEDSTFAVATPNSKDLDKNLFKTTMINVPLMLETNIGKDAEHSFHLQIGGMLGYRLGSKTKQKFEENDKDYKTKNRNDYNLNDFRLNAVARIGYGDFTLFASYSLTEMFEDDKGPELYPFTVGISLVSF